MTETSSDSAARGDSPVDAQAQQGAVVQQEVSRAWRTVRNLGGSLLGTWSVALLVRFLLPRHLGPESFGDITFADSFAQGFMLLAGLGIDTYAMREVAVEPRRASDFYGGVALARAGIGVLLLALMAIILALSGRPTELQPCVALCGVAWLAAAFNGTIATLLQASSSTGRLAVVTVLVKIFWGLGVAATIFLPSQRGPLWLYVLPATTAELLRLVLTYPLARQAVNLKFRVDVAATRQALWASVPYFISAIAITIGYPLNMAVLEYASTDDAEVGWYAAMMNLASLAMIFSPLLNWVLLPALSRARARSEREAERIIGTSLEVFTLAALPVVLIGWIGDDLWVRLSFGPAYLPAVTALRTILFTILITYNAMLLNMGMVAYGHSWAISRLSLVSLVSIPVLCLVCVPLLKHLLGAGGEAGGAALANALNELLIVGLSLHVLGRRLLSPRFFIRVGTGLAMFAVTVVIDGWLRTRLGVERLGLELVGYLTSLLLTGAVKLSELRDAIAFVRHTRAAGAGEPSAAEAADS